jgi:hypothetical protein
MSCVLPTRRGDINTTLAPLVKLWMRRFDSSFLSQKSSAGILPEAINGFVTMLITRSFFGKDRLFP